HPRRLREPGGRGARRPHRGRDREPRGDLRELHRHRAQADGGPGDDHRRPARAAHRTLRPDGGETSVSRALRIGLFVVVVGGAAVLPAFMSGFRLFQFTQVCIYAIALMGLNLLTGYNGQFSLGHGAFFAIGAYTSAIMMDRWDIAYGWTIPVA